MRMALSILEIMILVCFAGIIVLIYVLIYYLVRKVQNLKNVHSQQQYPYQPYQQSQYQHPIQQQPTLQPIQKGEMKLCKNCHAKLDLNWVSCPYCGRPAN